MPEIQAFTTPKEVEQFLSNHGIVCERVYYFQPLTKNPVPYWKVSLGKHPCEVYDIVEWANLVYAK